MIRAAVPEAAINEDCNTGARKDDVRPPGWRYRVHPVPEAGPPKQPPKHDLGGGVSAPNPRHQLRAAKRHRVRVMPGAITRQSSGVSAPAVRQACMDILSNPCESCCCSMMSLLDRDQTVSTVSDMTSCIT